VCAPSRKAWPCRPVVRTCSTSANARHAREHPDPDQQETIAWLRRDGEAVASVIASLSDAQLDRRARENADAEELTTEEVIRQRQVGHVRGHLVSIATVLGDAPDAG
jgi:hypothetical protein